MKTTTKLILVVAAAAAVSMLGSSLVAADDAPAAAADAAPAPVVIAPADAAWAENQAITRCTWCHGPQGHSVQPIYPALAGQKSWYITEQLQFFRAQSRADPYARGYMWGMASQLTDTQINALADYYSKQTPFASGEPPFSGSKHAALVAAGKGIYNDGDAKVGIPPCSACHGPDASGSDQFPRLAGQHASYLAKQLRAFHSNARDNVVMNGVAASLPEADIVAVSAYLESQH